MKQRTGTFQDFKDYTLAVARGERQVDAGEPKVWREAKARPLDDYTIGDLEETRQRIEETEAWVKRKCEKLPGPGWDHIRERLRHDRESVEAEINRRLPP
jgi:hypothetical protein